MHNIKYPLKISTGEYEVIHSGCVHIVNDEVSFALANLKINFSFKTDTTSDAKRYDGKVIDNVLQMNLFNFDSSLGNFNLKPVNIGTLDGRKLFCTWFVNTMESSNQRQFNYTFMLSEA